MSVLGPMSIVPRNWCHNNKHFSDLAPPHGGKTALKFENSKKLHHGHPII